jgi:8-hydroxy-5-deazaflavin:NADPH oxidoreductase
MRIGVVGAGTVGRTLASKLVDLGHDVMIGVREPARVAAWVEGTGGRGRSGVPDDAARHGDLVISALPGHAVLAAMAALAPGVLDGKVLLDVSNPLDFSSGSPPTLLVKDTDSLGEQLQRALPNARVVKSLNTVNVAVMVDPGSVGSGDHTVYVAGNDAGAKGSVVELLGAFGWRDVIDLGDITASRGLEMLLPLWLRLMTTLGTPAFNFRVVR